MKKEKVKLDDFEKRLIIYALSELRNKMIEEDMPTEDINDLLLKLIDG